MVNKNTTAYANKKRYISEYNKKEYMTISITINKSKEPEMVEKLSKQKSKAAYIKNLIKKDLKSS